MLRVAIRSTGYSPGWTTNRASGAGTSGLYELFEDTTSGGRLATRRWAVDGRAGGLLCCWLLVLVGVACGGGGDRGGDRFELYHLETAIGPPGTDGELRCGPPRVACPGVLAQPPPRSFRYRVLAAPAVTDADVDRSGIRQETDAATGSPLLIVALTAEGRKAYARLTKEVARTGGRDQGWHHVAVVVGDEIVAFPEIDFDVYPDGLPDAPAIQVVAASDADARALVERLRGE